MEFKSCASPTVGIEWELQLLDSVTLDLRPGIMPLMEFFPDREFIKPEFIQSCVELNSCVAATSAEAVRHIATSLGHILGRCKELDMTACGAGTHPFCRRLALITPTPRYRRLKKSGGFLAHVQLTFSTHVHVGMASGDEAMRAMSRLAPALPAFVALSANSPFWRGHETGHASYRQRILAAAPNYGLPERFGVWSDFERFYLAAQRAQTIRSFKDIHWAIRPHPDFGTLEIRAMDSAPDLRSLHGLVAFARSMAVAMATLADNELARLLPFDLPDWATRENYYRAGHKGLDASFIFNDSGDVRPLRGLIEELISLCRPVADEIGESAGLDVAASLLTEQSGYRRQLAVYEDMESTVSVTDDLRSQLRADYDASNSL